MCVLVVLYMVLRIDHSFEIHYCIYFFGYYMQTLLLGSCLTEEANHIRLEAHLSQDATTQMDPSGDLARLVLNVR